MSNGGRADGPLVLWPFGLNRGLTGGREREMADSNILIMTLSMLLTTWMMVKTIFMTMSMWITLFRKNTNAPIKVPNIQNAPSYQKDYKSIDQELTSKWGQISRKKLEEKG